MPSSLLGRLGAGCLIAAVSLGAAIAFAIQPLATKLVLPRFAEPAHGTELVNLWLQAASCLGFLAAWIASCLAERRTGVAVLLIGGAATLTALLVLKPDRAESLIACLAPFCLAAFVLSTAQVLLPYWFGRAQMPVWVDPYFVFAFVNLGAILGTLGYLLAVEPWLTLGEQMLGVGVGVAATGILWVTSLFVLQTAGTTAPPPDVRPGAQPTLGRRIRWVILAAIPAMLALLPSPTANRDAGQAAFLPVALYQLTLIVAFARFPRNWPSPLSWIVQILALATCATLAAVFDRLDDRGIPILALAIVIAPALVPHRWTLGLQAALSVIIVVIAWNTELGPLESFVLFGALMSAVGWGCHGDLLAARPASESLPQFLFFTGIAASLLAAFAVQLCGAVPPWPAYLAVVLLALAARFLPREPRGERPRTEWDMDSSGSMPANMPSTAVFKKDRRVQGSGPDVL